MKLKISFEDNTQSITVALLLSLLSYYISKSYLISFGFAGAITVFMIALQKRHVAFFDDFVQINNRLWGRNRHTLKYGEISKVIISSTSTSMLMKGTVEIIYNQEGQKRLKFSYRDAGKIMVMKEILISQRVSVEPDPS